MNQEGLVFDLMHVAMNLSQHQLLVRTQGLHPQYQRRMSKMIPDSGMPSKSTVYFLVNPVKYHVQCSLKSMGSIDMGDKHRNKHHT